MSRNFSFYHTIIIWYDRDDGVKIRVLNKFYRAVCRVKIHNSGKRFLEKAFSCVETRAYDGKRLERTTRGRGKGPRERRSVRPRVSYGIVRSPAKSRAARNLARAHEANRAAASDWYMWQSAAMQPAPHSRFVRRSQPLRCEHMVADTTACYDSSVVSVPLPGVVASVASNVHVRFDLRFDFFFFFPPFFPSFFCPPLLKRESRVVGWRSRVAQLRQPGPARIATNALENVARENATEKDGTIEGRSPSVRGRYIISSERSFASGIGVARESRLSSFPIHPIGITAHATVRVTVHGRRRGGRYRR